MINLIERCRPQAEVYNRLSGAYVRILAQLGISTAACTGVAQGELLFEKALSLARKIDNVATTAYVKWMYGLMLAYNNDGEKAIQHLERAIKLLEESQTILLQGVAWSWLGYAHSVLGQADSATDLTEKGLKIHSGLGVSYWRSVCHYCCSHAYFKKGDLEVSRAHAERAVQYSRENHEKQVEGISKAWLGQVLARINLSQLETASEILWQGIRQLEELGILAFTSMGYFWLGEINAEAGYKDTALLHLRKAEALFQTMGMNHWLEKAKHALAKI